jgi:hypothetical protein
LQEINDALEEEVRLVCMGGFVIAQLYGFSRPTVDIDALGIDPKSLAGKIQDLGDKSGPLHSKYKIYLHFVTVAAVPENYDERLAEMYAGAFPRLRIFALDPYDLALSKLQRNIQRDRDDVFYLARTIPFDLKVLRERYQNEMRYQMGVPQREDLTLQMWIDAIEEERWTRR